VLRPKRLRPDARNQALERNTSEAGIARGVALMDAGHGADTDLRDGITALGLTYAAGIGPNTSVWAPGTAPLPPKPWSGQGRPTTGCAAMPYISPSERLS